MAGRPADARTRLLLGQLDDQGTEPAVGASAAQGERFAVLAQHIAGVPYPAAEILHAWKLLLFNQFHDILPGSAIRVAAEDAIDQFGEVRSVAARVANRAVQAIARLVDVPFVDETKPLLVFNPHPWTLHTTVEVETSIDGIDMQIVDHAGDPVVYQYVQPAATVGAIFGQQIRRRMAFPVSVPPMGHGLYRVLGGQGPHHPTDLVAAQTSLENDLVRVEIDPATGWLSSLLDKRTGVDLLAGVVAPHTVVTDDPSDTWGHRIISYVGPGESFEPTRIQLIQSGPVRATVRVESRLGESTLVEELSLTAGSPLVHVEVILDWREKCRLLKLRVPTALADAVATYEIPFGHLRRPADGVERPGQAWVDLTGTIGDLPAGLAVINDAKYAYDVSGADLGITAARSPVFAWHDPARLDPDAFYDYQDQGVQRFSYQLLPHAGDWRDAQVDRHTAELLMAPVVLFEGAHPGPIASQRENLRVEDTRILITAVKASEDDATAVVIRAVETEGRSGPATIQLPVIGRVLTADFGPYEIKTLVLSADPGSPAVETDIIELPLTQ